MNTHLEDKRIMATLSDNMLPAHYKSNNKPKGYGDGDIYGKRFVGPLLLWEVMITMYKGSTKKDLDVIKYLLDKNVDRSHTISYLDWEQSIWERRSDHPVFELLDYEP